MLAMLHALAEFLTALLPRSLEFGPGDVPVRSAFRADGTQVLAEVFHRGASEEPVAIRSPRRRSARSIRNSAQKAPHSSICRVSMEARSASRS